jgi:prolyl oligopeptidase
MRLVRFTGSFAILFVQSWRSTSAFLVSSFAAAAAARRPFFLDIRSPLKMTTSTDPYLWLEDVDSQESLDFAKAANDDCLRRLGHPEESPTQTYQKVLRTLESDDRIPQATVHGRDDDDNQVVFNFWKDATNPKGIWRKTTMDSYKTDNPTWTTVLNIDDLAEQDGTSWVYKGSRGLPRGRDPTGGKLVSRALIMLSDGGADAVHVREFDLTAEQFVTDQPFELPEAKSRVSYKSSNVLYVGSDFGPESLTDSGYPRTVREWVRGTNVNDAPVVFEGDKKDISVSAFISDERIWGGGIYEVRSRSLTFYTNKCFVRKIEYEHTLAPEDPMRQAIGPPPEFVEVDVQEDAEIDFLGNLLLISLRSDWEPTPNRLFKRGSLIYTGTDEFLAKGKAEVEFKVLFEPTERTAYEYFTVTKNHLVLSSMDNVKAKLDFYKIEKGSTLIKVSGDLPGQIRDCNVRPLDPYDNGVGSDEFWFSTSDFTTPSTLFLADASRVATHGSGSDAFIVEKIKSLPPQFDATDLKIAQQVAVSKDGTEVPYFIVRNKNAKTDGKNPTLLYGYGGFEISLGPHYIATPGLGWLERGGVYVEANIRGGGEFGPSWHQAALKENRNKAYEDFIAVAEHLIATGECTAKSLACRGGSNVSGKTANK